MTRYDCNIMVVQYLYTIYYIPLGAGLNRAGRFGGLKNRRPIDNEHIFLFQ